MIYDPLDKKVRFIDLHRSRYQDYVQDVSVFMVSNYRLQVLDAGTRARIADVASDGEQTLDGTTLGEFMKKQPVVIDVRPKDEFAARFRAKGAVSVPIDTILGEDETAPASGRALKRRKTFGSGVSKVKNEINTKRPRKCMKI